MTSGPTPSDDAPVGRRLSQLANIPVTRLTSVGAARARALHALGIDTILDLLTHYPRRWEDWTRCVSIAALRDGDQVNVVATVVRVSRRRGRSGRSVVDVVLRDETGRITCTFFNQTWLYGKLEEGAEVVASGKVSSYRGSRQMANPRIEVVTGEVETLEIGRIVAIYPLSEKVKLQSAALARFVAEALERAGDFADPLPERFRTRLGLVTRTEAFAAIHRPESETARLEARQRLAFDELWRLQCTLVMRKRASEHDAKGIAHRVTTGPGEEDLVGRFLESLPFPLTGSQIRVLGEIATDLGAPVPMHRLLQGDVGSGKTVVALAALLYGVAGGYQGAFMVPTEVLAEQHFLASLELLGGCTVADASRRGGRRALRVELLTARTTAAERTRLRGPDGRLAVDILVGTHALLTEDVRFSSLGVVVIDEQHRFGVDQRAALREKGSAPGEEARDPDLLVMTATPIPRTAAMTVYGDLDYSVLDELPPGRTSVSTELVADEAGEAGVWSSVREEVARGHQAFVVCPLVRAGTATETKEDDGEESFDVAEETAPSGAAGAVVSRPPRAAVEEAAHLSNGPLSGCRVGLLHGQLPAKEKQAVMAAFRDGALDVLVATTVVEVGVDVANATVMVICDAERFGIAQLHQLRGRVGRSDVASRCYLLAPNAGEEAGKRLAALTSTSDGFELAEVDLELRGEGTVLASRQKGRTDLKLASLRLDRDLVLKAREVAEALVGEDPDLVGHSLLADELRLFLGDEEAQYLFRS